MATASVTYTFVNGTSADASEVNTNFLNLVNFLNNSVIHADGSVALATDQVSTVSITDEAVTLAKIDTAAYSENVVTGTLALRTTDGRLRAADPTANNNVTTKAYVDGLVALTQGTLASGTIRYAKQGSIVVVVTTNAGWNMASATLPSGFRPAVSLAANVHSLASGTDDPISNVVTISTGGVLTASLSASKSWFSFSFVAA